MMFSNFSVLRPAEWFFMAAIAMNLIPFVSNGQSTCDSLIVNDIRYTSFNDSLLQVDVSNLSSDIFAYPGFVLLDQNNDTLAKEVVDFFGIGQTSVHKLVIYPGVSLPSTGSVTGTLHLWTGFYQTLACTFPVQFAPCPPPPCASIRVSITNTGGALVNEMIDWTLLDQNNTAVANGTFELNPTMQMDEDTVCLGTGMYTLSIESPLITGGQLYYWVDDLDQFYFSGVHAFYQQGASMNEIGFTHFNSCPSLVNGISIVSEQGAFYVVQSGNSILVELEKESINSVLSIYDQSGRMIARRAVGSEMESFHLPDMASGQYYVALEKNGVRSTQKLRFDR